VTSSIPQDLQLVIDFVNTRDLETGTDELASPDALLGWMRQQRLAGSRTRRPSASDLDAALELREALRSAMLAHNGGPPSERAARTFEQAARRGDLSVCFQADGAVEMTPRAAGFDGMLAKLLVPVVRANADGTWERVKACRADDCLWAFYDASRNRSGRWCNMAVCGNRTKVRSYRSRHSESGEARP
jgi:predicted RNA-binding Zn ribbon-like protein